MSARQEAIGRPSSAQSAKDLVFRLALLACLALAIGLLAVLLVDVALDGAGTLNWAFIDSFTSISADKAGSATPPAPEAAPAPAPTSPGGGQYTVQPGDTLSRIAAAQGVDWQALYAVNVAVIGADPAWIFPGQLLNLP